MISCSSSGTPQRQVLPTTTPYRRPIGRGRREGRGAYSVETALMSAIWRWVQGAAAKMAMATTMVIAPRP